MSSPQVNGDEDTESRLLRAFLLVEAELTRLTASHQQLLKSHQQLLKSHQHLTEHVRKQSHAKSSGKREALEQRAILACHQLAQDHIAGRSRFSREAIANIVGVPESTLRYWPEFSDAFRKAKAHLKIREVKLAEDDTFDSGDDG